MLVTTKAQVIDLVRKVENVSLHLKSHQNITVSVRRDVEVSWNSIDFKETL
jgi:hypothetical protein